MNGQRVCVCVYERKKLDGSAPVTLDLFTNPWSDPMQHANTYTHAQRHTDTHTHAFVWTSFQILKMIQKQNAHHTAENHDDGSDIAYT